MKFPGATHLVILVSGHPQQTTLLRQIQQRLLEELGKLQVEVNQEKTRLVDLTKDESFDFLGFEFRRVRGRNGKWYPLKAPRMKKRTELISKIKQVFQQNRSQPLDRIIAEINRFCGVG